MKKSDDTYDRNSRNRLQKSNRKEIANGLYNGQVPRRNLWILAHSDDIAIGLGGLARMLSNAGGLSESFIIIDQKGRRFEEIAANRVLGIGKTEFLSVVDGDLDFDKTESVANIIREKIIDRGLNQFDNIISFDHAGYTGHPDHITASYIAENLFNILPNVKYLTFRSMSDEEKKLWEPYFIPIPWQENIPGKQLDISTVMRYKIDSIAAHRSQWEIDGKNHVARMQNMAPTEKYRIVTK